jgi:flagellar hook-associated protein 1 FlgK
MTNYTSKIIGNAVSGIRSQQAMIANVGNNIANVNTPGYSRRTVNLESRAGAANGTGLNIGNGVQVGSIQRNVDQYLERQTRDVAAEAKSAETVSSFLERVDHLFSLNTEQQTVGNSLTSFFVAANDLSLNPASIELRQALLEKGEDLVGSISNTYNELANLQDEAGERIDAEISTVNSITTQIAGLNARIAGQEVSGGGGANDEKDKRALLLKQLSEKISFSTIENSDGSISVALENGFTLVSGSTARNLSTTTTPSFGSGTLPQSLSGGVLSYIVYDYSNGAGTQQVDFTNFLKDQNGTIGGLLKVRGYVDPALATPSAFQADGHLVEIASRIEAITRTLLTSVNQTYLGPDRSAITAGHQPSSGDLNGAVPSTYGLFDFTFGGVKDTDVDGFPDDYGTHNLGNYSSLLTMAFTDPRRVAAARDATPLLATPSFAPGDGRNIAAIAGLRSQSLTFTAGTFSLTGTFDEAYQETVTTVSNKQSRADLDQSVSEAKLVSIENQREAVSGVSLEEEFTSLIGFQKSFEASARMVRTAQELLDTILQLI